jgi:lipid-A-disaccharide synthase
VIKRVRKSRIKKMPKFYHVVAPMVWAWGAWRAKKYARVFDKMFCFFDFEVPYFTKYGLDAVAIGHPIYDIARRELKKAAKKYIALLPGSRMGEASKIMPVFKELAARCGAAQFAIPTTETTHDFISREIETWPARPKLVPFADRYKLYNETKLAVATSGTATAELAIMHIPAVVVYRVNWLTALLANVVLKTKHIALANILANKKIYPEFRGRSANADNIVAEIGKMNPRAVIGELAATDKLWHKNQGPVKIVVDAISHIWGPSV